MSADVNTPSSTYRDMLPDWELVLALLGGTRAMRAAGRKYLPQYAREEDAAYRERLNRTVLFNYFAKVLSFLATRPFSKPVRLGESAPEELKALAEDVDRLGSDVTSWARAVFKDGLAKGLTHVLVDFPAVDPEAVRTLEDEKRAGLRPYFVHVPAEALIAAYVEVVDGEERLTHARIRESEVRREGFEEVKVERVRVLEPDSWAVYERSGTSEWAQVGGGPNKLGFIPLVTWYAHREGFQLAKPPLLDLAHKNVEHWQSSSDQRNVLTVARFPMLAASGVAPPPGSGEDGGQGGGLKVGPHSLLTTESPQGKFYYVEHSGAAIEAGRKDLEDLKEEMAALGVELLVRKSGSSTATEKSINTAQSHSELQALAESFGDALELAFHFAARWLGLEVEDGALKVEVHTDFGLSEGDAQGLDVLFKARAAREISRQAFLTELKRRGVLAPDFNAEVDADLLQAEGPALGTLRPAPAPGTSAGQQPSPGGAS
ncbi:DUF4055 domain-containing protein [Pyxidicoccus caerfyrddinensis]|uniref:DUF4055 domain-containing protein n=1 Tax=Pyxidicoccus caerfyrddinensis TaxID=2709663 RepID=UPI0013DAC00C|nr:DUF4055 domain-containing protein [Pyxidicoccus caerfyrddinensis]